MQTCPMSVHANAHCAPVQLRRGPPGPLRRARPRPAGRQSGHHAGHRLRHPRDVVHYYDAFEQKTLGNYRERLLEVTLRPLDGKYLTHSGSAFRYYHKRVPRELRLGGHAALHARPGQAQPGRHRPRDTAGRDAIANGIELTLTFAHVLCTRTCPRWIGSSTRSASYSASRSPSAADP